ncbi:MAG: ureidoglycolate lyase [Christensenellales bacterium]|jgi:ureidoglycolate lyase
MRTISVKTLSREAFAPYGEYHNLLSPDPSRVRLGNEITGFWPDLCAQALSGALVSYSASEIHPRPLVITKTEYHNHCGEAMLPINADMILHVGPAVAADVPPLDRFEAFLLPAGTIVTIRPGVWHHSLFVCGEKSGVALIALPPRTYKNDCVAVTLSEDEQIRIALP